MKPLIGITPDEGLSPPAPGRPSLPRYELKQAYVEAVVAAGAVPLVLPYVDSDSVERYVGLCDGLLVTGGAFDVSPEEYGEARSRGLGPLKPARTAFERRLMELMLAAEKPLLGVCGGMQLLNVVAGGSLLQHIPDEVPGALQHEQTFDPREPAHEVMLDPESMLARIVGRRKVPANTTHHQAVARVGRGLVVCGRSEDGVVEAIEGSGRAFVLGVQWHPELLGDEASRSLYAAFVEACR